jgi:hypothetical protein
LTAQKYHFQSGAESPVPSSIQLDIGMKYPEIDMLLVLEYSGILPAQKGKGVVSNSSK